MGIHMRNGINYTWGSDGIAREIETIWDTGFTPSPGVWLTYDFGVDFEDYDELIFVIGRGGEANPITEFTMHPKKIGINSLNDVNSGLVFKFDVWGGNVGWIAHDSGTTYSLGADYGGSPPKYIAIYGVKYINSNNNEYSYSTTEHKIGTWIDGSDLYERTYLYTGTGAANPFSTTIDTTGTRIKEIIPHYASFTYGGGQFGECIGTELTGNTFRAQYTDSVPPNLTISSYLGSSTETYEVCFTMRYIKTT